MAREEFPDIVMFVEELYGKLRLHIIDGSYLDVWFSRRISGRYAYHSERRHINGSIYRHDNRPHTQWREMETFPKHFHYGSDGNVQESYISDDPAEAIRSFLSFVKKKIKKEKKDESNS